MKFINRRFIVYITASSEHLKLFTRVRIANHRTLVQTTVTVETGMTSNTFEER